MSTTICLPKSAICYVHMNIVKHFLPERLGSAFLSLISSSGAADITFLGVGTSGVFTAGMLTPLPVDDAEADTLLSLITAPNVNTYTRE